MIVILIFGKMPFNVVDLSRELCDLHIARAHKHYWRERHCRLYGMMVACKAFDNQYFLYACAKVISILFHGKG